MNRIRPGQVISGQVKSRWLLKGGVKSQLCFSDHYTVGHFTLFLQEIWGGAKSKDHCLGDIKYGTPRVSQMKHINESNM